MMCNITGCDNRARRATKSSWRDLGICPLCAYELYLLNKTMGLFSQYKKKISLTKVRPHFNPNPLGVPTRSAMLEIIKDRPLSKKELKQELYKRYNYSLAPVTFRKHYLDLIQEKLIKEVGTDIYLNMEMILA